MKMRSRNMKRFRSCTSKARASPTGSSILRVAEDVAGHVEEEARREQRAGAGDGEGEQLAADDDGEDAGGEDDEEAHRQRGAQVREVFAGDEDVGRDAREGGDRHDAGVANRVGGEGVAEHVGVIHRGEDHRRDLEAHERGDAIEGDGVDDADLAHPAGHDRREEQHAEHRVVHPAAREQRGGEPGHLHRRVTG